MSSPSNRKQKVKVRYEQQLRENRIRRPCLRGILHNDIRSAERRTPRQQRTPGTGAPADAGASVWLRTPGTPADAGASGQHTGTPADAGAPGRLRTSGTGTPADAGAPGRATCNQTERGATCRSCSSCQSACLWKAGTLRSGASPPCAVAPWRPSPHPEPCALLGETGRSDVA